MKEERLIGNSGIQEIRQQCLDLLAEIREQAGILNDYFEVTDNPEYIAAWVDGDGKVVFGLKADGKTYVGDADFLNNIKNNQEAINEIKSYLANFDNLDINALSSITAVENPEFIEAKTDSEGKLLAGRTPDGAAFEKVGFSAPKVSIDAHTIENIEDPEGRSEITTDSEGRIISYRDAAGVKHENVGIETLGTVTASKIIETSRPDCTVEKYVYLERPTFGEFRFYGELPTDTSDERTPTNLDFIFKVDGQVKLSAKCTLAIQGHGTASYNKKGYTFEPLNNKGKAIDIKFGNMIATDSFHLKAFKTDPLQCRDVGAYRIWEALIRSLDYPYNKINNIPFEFDTEYDKNFNGIEDAQYHPDGFPCVFYLNDEFHGLYTLRLKKSRQNYAMEKSHREQIFLDATNYNYTDEQGVYHRCSCLSIPFDHRGWDLKNPKLKNYEEGGEILNAGVLANIERLFNFTSGIKAAVDDFKQTEEYKSYHRSLINQGLSPGGIAHLLSDFIYEHFKNKGNELFGDYADYIVLPHWLIFIITEELLYSEDTAYNNMNLLTWDATHWSILPYDMELTYGLHAWTRTIYDIDKVSGLLLTDVFPYIESLFDSELKSLYTMLRNNKIISIENIMSVYRNQIKSIPRTMYEDDFKKWGSAWDNGYPTFEHLNRFAAARIDYLDSIWLNN